VFLGPENICYTRRNEVIARCSGDVAERCYDLGGLELARRPLCFSPLQQLGGVRVDAGGSGNVWAVGLGLVEGKSQLSVGGARLSLAALLPLGLVPLLPRSLSAPLRRYAEQYPRPHAVVHATALLAALWPGCFNTMSAMASEPFVLHRTS